MNELALALALGELTVLMRDEGITVYGPFSGADSPELPATRQPLRDVARTDERGRYRPLTGARTLRRNWQARFATLQEFSEAISEVYPLALEHNAQWGAGELRVAPLDEVLARQSARYAVASRLDAEGRAAAREALCSRCVRVPVWAGASEEGRMARDGAIACPEACSVMVSLCREGALWQEERPAEAAPDPAVPFAAFEQPGNEIREAYLRRRYASPDE